MTCLEIRMNIPDRPTLRSACGTLHNLLDDRETTAVFAANNGYVDALLGINST